MRLLVTGGAGFIGSNFVRQSFNLNFNDISSILVLDKLTYAGVKENLDSVSNLIGYSFVHGDICDTELVNSLVSEVDAVVNFAAESHVDRSIPSAADFVSTNVAGVQVLLDAFFILGAKSAFCRFLPMKCTALSNLAHGMRANLCCQTHLIRQVKPEESYWLALINAPTG